MTDTTRPIPDAPPPSERPALHVAEDLLAGGKEARIALGDQTYTLRLTRAGKLILTK